MRRLVISILAVIFVFVSTVLAQSGSTLTPSQREEIVRLATAYSANPNDASLDQQATAMAKLLPEIPDFPAPTCADHLPWIEKKKYKHARELSVAYYLGTGSYMVQHAGARPSMLYYPALFAGAEAALRAYQSLLQLDSSAKLDKMDDWSSKQKSSQLMPYLEKTCERPNPALSRPKGPLTAEERQRILELAGLLQQSPLDPALRPEYQELFIVVVQASDFTVEICTASSPWMDDKPEYKYGSDLLALNLMAMSAHVLRNPETGKEGFAHNRAGLTASLRGYEAVLKQEPAAHSKALDELLLLEKQGQLDDWFRARYAKKCTKK